MKAIPVIAVADVGKTNKKIFLLDEHYQLVFEKKTNLEGTVDEDQFASENVELLSQWLKESIDQLLQDERFEIKAINFSAYGASFVYLDENFQVIPPLYNYLKPYPTKLLKEFYNKYGGESALAKKTASPVLGSLNSGMQLYRLKYEQPEKFASIKHALHLPQYLSFVLSGKLYSDITSIGCHTNLWSFHCKCYHEWVAQEGITEKLAPITEVDAIGGFYHENIPVGIGLHDSSAALIPYLTSFHTPFILLSTGTWCISINPFNHTPLTDYELYHDCLCYLSFSGKPVKASRLFAGHDHEQQVKRIAKHFHKEEDYFTTVEFDKNLLHGKKSMIHRMQSVGQEDMLAQSVFQSRKLDAFSSYEEAYHQLIMDIIVEQTRSTKLVLGDTKVKQIIVDGGFSNNAIYMQLLAEAFPEQEVYAATIAQASTMGAALVMHKHWNKKPIPSDIIQMKHYSIANA